MKPTKLSKKHMALAFGGRGMWCTSCGSQAAGTHNQGCPAASGGGSDEGGSAGSKPRGGTQ